MGDKISAQMGFADFVVFRRLGKSSFLDDVDQDGGLTPNREDPESELQKEGFWWWSSCLSGASFFQDAFDSTLVQSW
jgi:hypothetical protein